MDELTRELLAMLKRVEWEGCDMSGETCCCPVCQADCPDNRWPSEAKHFPDCELAALLKRAENQEPQKCACGGTKKLVWLCENCESHT